MVNALVDFFSLYKAHNKECACGFPIDLEGLLIFFLLQLFVCEYITL